MLLLYYFLTFSAIYILMGWSMYLPYKMGHLHFFPITVMAVSAYFTGIASREWNWPFLIILAVGILFGLIISYGVSLLIGDAPCFSVVIVGLTSMFIVKTVIENWDWLGGSIGFFNIPSTRYLLFWTYLLLLLVGYLIFFGERAQVFRKASVIFYDRTLAVSLGIQVKKMGILLHSFSGILAGLSGILYALLIGGLTVDFFSFSMIGTLMAILFVGGHSSMWGVVLAAPLLGGIPILLPNILGVWKQVVYGVLLIAMICFRPEGLITRKQIFTWSKQFKQIFNKIF